MATWKTASPTSRSPFLCVGHHERHPTLACVGLRDRTRCSRGGGWERSLPAASCHGELAWKFSVEKQGFALTLQPAENMLSLQNLIFLYASKKADITAFSVFLMQNLEHCQPQHGKNIYGIFWLNGQVWNRNGSWRARLHQRDRHAALVSPELKRWASLEGSHRSSCVLSLEWLIVAARLSFLIFSGKVVYPFQAKG